MKNMHKTKVSIRYSEFEDLKKIDKSLFESIKSKNYSFFVESSFVLNKHYEVKSLPIEMPIRFAEKSKMSKMDMIGVAMAPYGLKLRRDGAIGHRNLLETNFALYQPPGIKK